MSYDEFGKLRFLDFFPKTDIYYFDDDGGTESGIGLACADGYACTCFYSPLDTPGLTAEISVDFSQNESPETAANTLFDHLGIPLRRGMSKNEIKRMLGQPASEDSVSLSYLFGDNWQYYLNCDLFEDQGLFRVWICRRDLADKNPWNQEVQDEE